MPHIEICQMLKFQDSACQMLKFQDSACQMLKFQDSACQILKFAKSWNFWLDIVSSLCSLKQ